MSKKINFSPINASDAKDVHDLQKKLFPPELTESLEEITAILSNADQLFNCNHSFAVYDNLKMIGYIFAYIDSKSIFHNRDEEIFYIKEFGLLPGYERCLRLMIFKLTYIWLTFAPQLAMEAHAVEEAKNKWLRLPKIQQQFETELKIRRGDQGGDATDNNDPDYFLLRWEAGRSNRIPKSYSLPRRGWEYQENIFVSVISDVNRLEALRADWNKLLSKTDSCNFLASFDYLVTWWKYFGTWRDLFVIVIRRENEVIGIAPLMKQYRHRAGRLERKLSMLGMPGFNIQAQLLFAGDAALCGSVMMAFLTRKESTDSWEEIVLEKQYSPSLADKVSACLLELPFELSLASGGSTTLQLGNNFQHFVENQLPTKKTYNRLLELETEPDYAFYADFNAGHLSHKDIVETLSQFEEENGDERADINQDGSYYFFYAAIVGLIEKENKLRWFVYRKNNKILASNLGFVEDDVFYSLIQSPCAKYQVDLADSLLLSGARSLIAEGVSKIRFINVDNFKTKFLLARKNEYPVDYSVRMKRPFRDRLKSRIGNFFRR